MSSSVGEWGQVMNSLLPGIRARQQSANSDAIQAYISALRETSLKEKTEHTDRHALKSLLEKVSPRGITVINEPKRMPGKGAPDFRIRQNGQIVGYAETKPIGTDLAAVLRSEQLGRYLSFSKNLLLTDYVNWVWVKDGTTHEASLCDPDDLFSLRPRLDDDRISKLDALLRAFTSTPPERVSTANHLADALATRSRLLRDFLGEELQRQDIHGQGERLYGLYSAFKQQVSETITLPEFADAFAQTLAYGLFLSKLNANGHSLKLANAKQYIPTAFKLIQELVSFLDELNADCYKEVRFVVDEILSIINGMNVAKVKESLSFKNRTHAYRNLKASSEEEWRLFSRDPFIYFYEDYLAQYDKDLKQKRGVFYTPPPVVNFIVRSADEILRTNFGIGDGLGDHEQVTVLDFACGTGTFVVEICERIAESAVSSAKTEMLIRGHVLKNICAFEYLIAPYTIAHLKLSQYLEDRQIKLREDERFRIYLTNTLEPLEPQRNYFVPALSEEAERALEVKKTGVLVITGNPPYAGHSQNKGKWITAQVRKYREGVPELNKPGQGKWLQNDYVKFIRFAQYEMDQQPQGLVAIITDNSYLDNPTFRGMRKSLMGTFNQIYIVDLHGNANKQERTPSGTPDENVFEIKQGVSIAFFAKKPGAPRGVWRTDVWGKQIEKYKALADARFSQIEWEEVKPAAPQYLFTAVRSKHASAYNKFWAIPEIFSPLGNPAPGIVTTHDQFAISWSREEAASKVRLLVGSRNEAEARKQFRLCKQEQWNYANAKKALRNAKLASQTVPILFQPFDDRFTVWNGHVAVHRRQRVMKHMFRDNVAISVIRKADVQGGWRHVFVSAKPITHHTVSMKEVNYLFPLYSYPSKRKGAARDLLAGGAGSPRRTENLDRKFRAWLDKKYSRRFDAESIMGFIYAVLHSPTYRERYHDFLRMDFPRIPFPETADSFAAIAKLGRQLMDAHLLKDIPPITLGLYQGAGGSNRVDKVDYKKECCRLHINKEQYFAPIPPDVWEFRIGGYQVLSNYLKRRKGRTLTLTEARNIERIANVIGFTLEQMQRIDRAYKEAFAR
jgi:predicted helicase